MKDFVCFLIIDFYPKLCVTRKKMLHIIGLNDGYLFNSPGIFFKANPFYAFRKILRVYNKITGERMRLCGFSP